ncbi:MAG: LuxR C-terminal-related transcriptional regulator [Eubacteriales bacterium]|nr:LuxR C-terminal-related transcriptional regulator [Eubacteriales bacterium]
MFIVAFLIAKPVCSLAAVLVSDGTAKLPYIIMAAAVLAVIAYFSRFIKKDEYSDTKINIKKNKGSKTPLLAFAGIFALFALIIFERMNCAFTLSVKETGSYATDYYLYFAGGFIMALAAYWMFVHKKLPVSVSLYIFLFTAIIHFILSVAAESGLKSFEGFDMVFFGISDIIYVFLFVTAASISNAYPDKRVFMGFVFVFGLSISGAFAFSHYLYVRFQSLYTIIYALTSLAMIAVCILMAPFIRAIDQRILPAIKRKSPKDTGNAVYYPGEPDSKCIFSQVTTAQLTSRENEIVELYLKGYSNLQISEMLHITPATVKVHCRNIYDKLNVNSRLELHFLFQDKIEKETIN